MIVIEPYEILLIIMSLIMLALVIMAFKHPSLKRPGGEGEARRKCARELNYLLILIGFAISCQALEYAFVSFGMKLFWCTLRFMTFVFLPPAVLRLYLRFSDSPRFLDRRAFLFMHIIPLFTLLMVLTNPWHHLFWTNRELVSSDYVSFIYNNSGIFFWVHSAYSYAILLAAYWPLFAGILKKPPIYRTQGYIMLVGACISLLINALYIFEVLTVLGDLTMPALFVSALCLYWAIYIHKPVKMIRIARSLAVNELSTPVVIFDNKNILIDANPGALSAMPLTTEDLFRLTQPAFFERMGFAPGEYLDEREVILPNEHYYHVMDKTLADKKSAQVGRYIVFNNITNLKQIVKKLEFSNTHDAFTGMYNRNVFQSELKKADKPEHTPIALISLNIYGMKFLNTVFGYEFGDRMIKLAAEAVTLKTADRGICARFSGDEFVIALFKTSERDAADFVQTVIEAANQTVSESDKRRASGVLGYGVHIALSSGIAVKGNRSENIDLVFKNAVSRMLRSKLLDAKAKSAGMFEFMKNVLQNNQYETAGHVERIQVLTQQIAEQMKFTPAQCENMRLLSLAHNIGILGTPADIIKKKGSLSNEEWEEVRLHTVRGYNIAMLFPDLTPIAEDILRHHERYDGLGYPDGLREDEIPIGAQIMLLVNYYDALIYPWPPDRPLTEAEALAKIKKQAGEMFSPTLVTVFTEIMGSSDTHTLSQAIIRQEDDAELMEILKLLDMD